MSDQKGSQKERRGFISPLRKAETGTLGGSQQAAASVHESAVYSEQPTPEYQSPDRLETATSNKPKREETHFRQTVWMPLGLATRLKVHAARTRQDISSIVVKLVESYLEHEEDR